MRYHAIASNNHPMYSIAIVQVNFYDDERRTKYKDALALLDNSFGPGIHKMTHTYQSFKTNSGDSSVWYYYRNPMYSRIYLTTPDQLTLISLAFST